MGERLTERFKANITLTAGSGGVLDVRVDGVEVFSKHKSGHFPTAEELIDIIARCKP